MSHKKYKLDALKQANIISGIYKINFPSGKSYIGLSNNIRKRILSHNERDFKLKRILGYAINKYGPITEFEVIEEIPANNRKLMSEREKYWIQYYNTITPNGYNNSPGGEGLVSNGINNGMSKFTQEDLDDILWQIVNNSTKSLSQIAIEYGVSRTTIGNINAGRSYYNPELSYPIRDKNKRAKPYSGELSSSAKLSDIQIQEIYALLKNTTTSQAEIARKFNVSPSTIGLINKGQRYNHLDTKYPIR